MNRDFCRYIECTIQKLIDEAPWDLRILKNCRECKARLFCDWEQGEIMSGRCKPL